MDGWVYVCTYVRMSTYVYVCTYVYMRLYTYVRMHVCMLVNCTCVQQMFRLLRQATQFLRICHCAILHREGHVNGLMRRRFRLLKVGSVVHPTVPHKWHRTADIRLGHLGRMWTCLQLVIELAQDFGVPPLHDLSCEGPRDCEQKLRSVSIFWIWTCSYERFTRSKKTF